MRHISLGFNTHYTIIKEDFRGVPFLFCVNIVRPAERRSPSAEKPGRDCFVASSHQGAHTPHMPLKRLTLWICRPQKAITDHLSSESKLVNVKSRYPDDCLHVAA